MRLPHCCSEKSTSNKVPKVYRMTANRNNLGNTSTYIKMFCVILIQVTVHRLYCFSLTSSLFTICGWIKTVFIKDDSRRSLKRFQAIAANVPHCYNVRRNGHICASISGLLFVILFVSRLYPFDVSECREGHPWFYILVVDDSCSFSFSFL